MAILFWLWVGVMVVIIWARLEKNSENKMYSDDKFKDEKQENEK